MEVFKKRGSKERLLEMMQGVNKVKINENLLNEEISPTLNHVYEALEMLKAEGLRDEKSTMQTVNDASYVGINGFDMNRNMYNFNFKLTGNESDQEGVFNLNDVILENFYFKSADGNVVIDLDENDLREVNQKFGSELYDTIEKYISSDVNENIDKKEDSQPFGGSKEKYQDGSGYGDEKPVNPDLRVKAKELDSFVKEGKFKDFEGVMKWVEESGEEEELPAETEPEDAEVEEIPAEEVPALDVDDVDQDGDNIEGGLADDADVMEFDPQQIVKGIEVEMEHTKDPKVALEIAMDHLKELPDYYTRLDAMEKEGEIDMETLTCPDKDMGSPNEFTSKLTDPYRDENGNPIPSIDPNFSDLSKHMSGIQDADKELESTMLGFNTNTPNKMEDE